MELVEAGHEVTIWMISDIPARMFFANERWTVTDCPTRLRESIWSTSERGSAMYGWRFQATNPSGKSFVFDVFRTDGDWHVHRTYE